MSINPQTGQPLTIYVYRGSANGELHLDPERGVFFSTEETYAAQYGEVVQSYEVSLSNPLVVTEEESLGFIEIDRSTLLNQGFDGRVVLYADGSMDIIAFHLAQVSDTHPAMRNL
jgi:hypothetical protein